MPNIFIISDTHFGHANILNFKKDDGTSLRVFSSVEDMDDHIVDRWNSVVRPQDKVYHLGDVAMRQQDIATAGRCNGHKRLILGNHDTYQTKRYMQHFEQIYGDRRFDNLVLSHIPLHPMSLRPEVTNVHGHVHNNVPQGHFGMQYYNVSCEMLDDYAPVSLEDLKLLLRKQQEDYA